MNRGGFVLSVLVLVAYMVLAGVVIRWCLPTGDKLSVAETLCGKEVKTMRTALLMAIAVAGCAGSGVDSQGLLPPGMRVPTPVEQIDAGDALMMAATDTLADLGTAVADALVPAADAKPQPDPGRTTFAACTNVQPTAICQRNGFPPGDVRTGNGWPCAECVGIGTRLVAPCYSAKAPAGAESCKLGVICVSDCSLCDGARGAPSCEVQP